MFRLMVEVYHEAEIGTTLLSRRPRLTSPARAGRVGARAEATAHADGPGGVDEMSTGFTGFRPEALDFLVELALNNDRVLVPAAQGRLRGPAQGAAGAAVHRARRGVPGPRHPALRRRGRSPFRIYRDVRFSKDKSPYKTNVGASFPWTGEGGGVGRLLPPRARAASSSAAACGTRRRPAWRPGATPSPRTGRASTPRWATRRSGRPSARSAATA